MKTQRCVRFFRPSPTLAVGLLVSMCLSLESGDLLTVRARWPGYRRGPVDAPVVSGNYLYAAPSSSGIPLSVIDISNPPNPRRVGGCDTGGQTHGLAVSGDHVYVAAEDSGLQVINVSDPARLQRSSDLQSWGDWVILSATGTAQEVMDTTASSGSSRFYRAAIP